jgi:hypothetical protein
MKILTEETKRLTAKKEAIIKESKIFVAVAKIQMPAINVKVFAITDTKRNGDNNDSNSLNLLIILKSLNRNSVMCSVSNLSVLGIKNFSKGCEKKTIENLFTCDNFYFKIINLCIYYPTNVHIDDWAHENTTETDKINNNKCDYL